MVDQWLPFNGNIDLGNQLRMSDSVIPNRSPGPEENCVFSTAQNTGHGEGFGFTSLHHQKLPALPFFWWLELLIYNLDEEDEDILNIYTF